MRKPVLLAVLLGIALGAAADERPNLLLITLDTTRADRLGCYGYRGAKTPVLDGLAARGILFEQAHTHVPLTLPSHATMLSGQLPSSQRLRVNGVKLREGVPTLATHLASRGYWTGAVVAAVVLHREYGLARGFDVYDDQFAGEERSGDEVTRKALEHMKRVRAPFFLWVHYFDPHYEYRPREPFAREFRQQPYDGEIASMDASIGALLDGLRGRGALKNTLIVVAGDHGESLMEHGERQHGVFLYESVLRVPLLMAWEGKLRAGTRVRELCGLSDVAPTLLDLLGGGSLGAIDGRSLRALLEGRSLPPRSVYAESYHGAFTFGWAPLRAILTEQWKFIDAPRPELYEWHVSEAANRYGRASPQARAARKELARYPPADELERARTQLSLEDEETRRRLASLGYLGGGTRERTAAPLDPKDAIGIEEELLEAKRILDAGDLRKATAMLESVLARNRENVTALSILGVAQMTAGEFARARSTFEAQVRLRPELPAAHMNLGTAQKRLGNDEQAMREYRAALAISPRFAEAAASLARMHVERRELAEARRVLNETLVAGGESAGVHFELGLVEASSGELAKARTAFTKAVSLDPTRAEAFVNLGRIAYQQGRIDESIANYERAVRLAPRNASYLATLGSLHLNGRNDAAEALRWYRQALAAEPGSAEARRLRELVAQLEAQNRR